MVIDKKKLAELRANHMWPEYDNASAAFNEMADTIEALWRAARAADVLCREARVTTDRAELFKSLDRVEELLALLKEDESKTDFGPAAEQTRNA
jgi:hypothetical protein